MTDVNHSSGFCQHFHSFSPIVFQGNALTPVSQGAKAGELPYSPLKRWPSSLLQPLHH